MDGSILTMMQSLVIVGASARAAAESARRAGYRPAAADLFGDRDLTAIAAWAPIEDYPRGAPDAASRLPAGPWIYTGGLENHPDLVDRISAARPLLGNPGDVLRRVRDPFLLAECLRRSGLDCPAVSRDPPPRGTNRRWLQKPLRSCGGHGIAPWDAASLEAAPDARRDAVYFQQWLAGPSYSAVFVAARGNARLLGVTRQLTGEPWTGADRFVYCGSLGPLALPLPIAVNIQQIGNRLADTFRLAGLFGVDMVIRGPRVFVIEVNPRYTASAEVLEQACGARRCVVQEHVQACCDGVLPPNMISHAAGTCGKAVLYARQPLRIADHLTRLVQQANQSTEWPPLADLPVDGAEIPAGHPILSLRVAGRSPQDAKRQLQRLADEVRTALSLDSRERFEGSGSGGQCRFQPASSPETENKTCGRPPAAEPGDPR